VTATPVPVPTPPVPLNVPQVAPIPTPVTPSAPPNTVRGNPLMPETIPSGYTSKEEDEYVSRSMTIYMRAAKFSSSSNTRNDFAEAMATVEQSQSEFFALGSPPLRLNKYASLISESLSAFKQGYRLAKLGMDMPNKQLLEDGRQQINNGYDLGHRAADELRRVEKGTP